MTAKLNPDATASHKVLGLFTLLLFSGRRWSLSELAKRFACSKGTILRLVESIEESRVAVIETGFEGRQKWYQMKRALILFPRGLWLSMRHSTSMGGA